MRSKTVGKMEIFKSLKVFYLAEQIMKVAFKRRRGSAQHQYKVFRTFLEIYFGVHSRRVESYTFESGSKNFFQRK